MENQKNTFQTDIPSGPLPHTLTNDYLFRALMQENHDTLKGLLCALLHKESSEIDSIEITNPIILGEDINAKTCILDLKLRLIPDRIINLELQVLNTGNWPERSIYYLSRAYTNLHKGEDYAHTIPAIHIGILDFTLFEDNPSFYAEYLLTDTKTHKIYSDKFSIRVLDLNQTDTLSESDKSSPLYIWAKLFKATTWEEILMLAEKNDTIKETVVTLRKLSEDEKVQLQCEAREKYEQDIAAMKLFGEKIGIQKGEQIGIQKGEQIGIQKGEQIGAQKEQIRSCKNLVTSLKKYNISEENIIKELMEKYQLSESEAKTYL